MFEIIILKNGVETGKVQLTEATNTIGRADGNQILLADDSVSRRHARLLLEKDRLYLEDLRSGNGTYLANRRVEGRMELKNGDEIQISPFALRVVAQVPATQILTTQPQPDARTVMLQGPGGPANALDPMRTGARLILRRGDAAKSSYPMGTAPLTIGRSEDRDVILTDPASSRRHATVSWMGDHFYVRDEGSANGIVLNGVPSREGALRPGDRLVIGETEFEFVWPGAPPRTEVPAMPGVYGGGFQGAPSVPGYQGAVPGGGHPGGIDPYSETGIMPAYPGFGAPGDPAAGMQGYGTPGYGAPGYGAPGYGAQGYGAPGMPQAASMTELGMPTAPKRSPLRLVAVAVVVLLFAAIGIKTIADKGKPAQTNMVEAKVDPCDAVGDTCPDPTDQACMTCLSKRARLNRGQELFRQGEYELAAQEFGRILKEIDPIEPRATRYQFIAYEFQTLAVMEAALQDRSQTAAQKLQKIKDDFAKGKELYDRFARASYTKDTPETTLADARSRLSEAVNLLNNVTKVHSDEKEAKDIQKEAETIKRNAQAQINRLRSIKEASAQVAFESKVQATFEEANQLKASGNMGKAAQKYREVIDLDKGGKTGYAAQAQAELDSLSKAMKDRAKPLVAEAASRMKNEQWIEARAKLQEALRIDPTLEEAQSRLATVDAECEARARKLFSEAKVQYNVSQYSAAEKLLKQVFQLVPDKSHELNQKATKMMQDMGKQ